MQEITIDGRKIGPNNPPYIIAELSANHNGDIERAFKIIEAAKKSGADAIKLQTYSAYTLTMNCDSDEFQIHGGLWDGQTLYELYKDAQMPWNWHKPLFERAKEIAAQDIKEIVLTGVNIGDFGKGEFGLKKHDDTFLDLVQALDKIDGIERIRISSIEPNLLKNEIIDFVGSSNRFVPHFHVPLQSVSDVVLKKMRRRYLSKLYVDRVTQIKAVMPQACIGVDVIVGFPGETEEEFLTTYRFLSELDIAYLHVFAYSERPNTEAVDFEGEVPQAIRNKRSKMLRGLSVKKRHAFYQSQLGITQQVLWEGENKKGYIHGFTTNYVKVRAIWNPSLVNTLATVTLEKIDEEGFVRLKA